MELFQQHVIRERVSMSSFLEDVQASRSDWEDIVTDQIAKIEGRPWEVTEDDFTVGLGLYAFILSVQKYWRPYVGSVLMSKLIDNGKPSLGQKPRNVMLKP